MASLPPLALPDPKKREKIDIPYDHLDQRLKRAAKSFVKWFIIFSLLTIVIIFATGGDVQMNMVLTAMSTSFQIIATLVLGLFQIVLMYGFLLWFLGRPKLEIIRPGDDTSVTFADYWGQPELVKLVKQWMSLLRDRKDFEKMGGKYISGLLLYGPPGTGKTMLAKAIAGESGMAFVSAEGTGFQGTFVGTDVIKVLQFAGKARALARKYGACVAYIDEIDAIGASRGGVRGGVGGMGGMSGGGMMGMGTFGLSTLLSQMDGMNSLSRNEKIARYFHRLVGRKYVPKRNWHVMWMGSTNRPEALDPALVRSGRLDTKIAVEAPDRASRRLIIQGYLGRIQHDDSIDLEAIVADTNSKTPADIAAAITKDSVRIAFFAGRRKVTQIDIDRAFMEQEHGMEMPVEEFDDEQRRVLAYHESGHAIAFYYMSPESKIVRATINPLSTGVKGYVQSIDTVEQHITPVNRLAYDIVVSFAGRACEKILTGETYQSVGGDYPSVRIRMALLIENGYFGPPLAGGANGPFGNSYDQYLRDNKEAESTLKKYWLMMEEATERLMRKHWREVAALAEELLIHKTLNGRRVVEIIEANQTPESLKDDIIPKTLAAIRQQAMAESRPPAYISPPTGGMIIDQRGAPVYGARPNPAAAVQTANPGVTVINGDGNGPAAPQYQPKISEEDEKGGVYVPKEVQE